MCTIVVARGVWTVAPLVIAANRDELLDRPSEPPSLRDGVLAPKDLQRGGTWIGVNERGLMVGLTNRMDVESERGRLSRGQIVVEALAHATASEAFGYASAFDGSTFNGFNLVLADRSSCHLVRSDGEKVVAETRDDALLVVTNHGVGHVSRDGDVEGLPRRVQNVILRWLEGDVQAGTPSPENLRKLLDIDDEWRHGTCVHEPDDNYGTKSSSVIVLDEAARRWRYWHRERTSLDRHVCAEPFARQYALPLRG